MHWDLLVNRTFDLLEKFGIVGGAWILESDSDWTLGCVICHVTLSLKLIIYK